MLGFGFRWLFTGSSTGALRPKAPRTVPTMLWVNELPIERVGFVLDEPTAWLDGLARPLLDTNRFAGMTSGRYETLAVSSARDITLVGFLLKVPMEALQEQLAALMDAWSGLVELRWPHAPNALQRGVAGPPQVVPLGRAFVNPDQQSWRISITIRCADNAVYQRQPTRVRLSSTPSLVPVFGLPVGGEVLINGPLTGDCDFDLLAPSGVLVERLALRNVALADGDYAAIRMDAPHLITKRTTAGAIENVYAWRSLLDSTAWWKAAPRHGDTLRGQHLRARLSAGTGWWTYLNAQAA